MDLLGSRYYDPYTTALTTVALTYYLQDRWTKR